MHEASLIAYRVQKAGRSACLGFGKPNPSPGGGGSAAKAFLLGSKEISLDTNGPSVRSAHCSSEAPNASFTLLSESLLSKRKYAAAASEDPTLTSALHECQAPSTQAVIVRSDGEPSEERL